MQDREVAVFAIACALVFLIFSPDAIVPGAVVVRFGGAALSACTALFFFGRSLRR